MTKIIITIVVTLFALFVSNWCFNHIDAWIGVLSYGITVIGLAYFVRAQIKKRNS